MAQVINHIYQFKRGTAQRWIDVNPILKDGEPGFEYDTGKFKIGDGFTPWVTLPYIGENSVFNAKTHKDFPKEGNENVLYKASEENALYQWDSETSTYQLLSSGDQLIDELVKEVNQLEEDLTELEKLLQGTIVLYGGSATDNIILLEENENA